MHTSLFRFRKKLLILFVALIVVALPVYYFNELHVKDVIKKSLVRSSVKDGVYNWLSSDIKSSLYNRYSPGSYLNSLSDNLIKKRQGYVTALTYSGQQGAGIQALTSLQCWATSFNLPVQILEPIMYKTNFLSFLKEDKNGTFMRFSDFFDVEHFNQVSRSIGFQVPIGKREDFFSNAPREVIFIREKMVPSNVSMTERVLKVVWSADSAQNRENRCYQDDKVNKTMAPLLKENFCIIKVIEGSFLLKSHYIFSDKEVQSIIYKNRSPQDTTLIFSFWRTPWYVENAELNQPDMCKNVGRQSSKTQFLPSPRLLSDSIRYEREYLGSSNEVALMLRIEHMIEFLDQNKNAARDEPWTVDTCLLEALKVTKAHLKSGRPMVTLDMGKFGSEFWNFLVKTRGVDVDGLTRKSELLVEALFDGKLTFEEWEDSFTRATGGVEHSGYIAALQRTLASRARCLVLVGGGTFQDLALKDYQRNHPNKKDQCVHRVCIKKVKQD